PTHVQKGESLTIPAGTAYAAGAGTGLLVEGTLVAEGTLAKPIRFGGTGWQGITIAAGGSATLKNVVIEGAATGITAAGGYAIDGLTSTQPGGMMALASTGTLAHATLEGQGEDQGRTPILISSGAPTLSDIKVSRANPGIDMIVVNGSATAPTFDHVEVTG